MIFNLRGHVSLRMCKECCVHSNPYIVQYKYIFRIFVSELFARWCDRCLLITKTLESPQSLYVPSLGPRLHTEFVAIQCSVCSPKLSCSKTQCVQICYAWKSGDFMKVYILLGHPPSCTIIRFQLRLAQSSSPVRILWCNRMFVHLGERESQSEAVVSFRTMVTFFRPQRVT